MKLFVLISFVLFIYTMSQSSMGQSWQPFGNPNDTVNVMASIVDSSSGAFIIAGYMPNFNSFASNYIWSWQNGIFTQIGNKVIGGIRKLNYFNGDLICAGRIDSIEITKLKMPIAKWNGITWQPFDTTTLLVHPFGGSTTPYINDVIEFDNKLFIIGTFRYDDPIFPFSNTFASFAFFDNTGWHPAVNNTIMPVDAANYPANFNIYNNDLYIGGTTSSDSCSQTSSSGPTTARGLVKYNQQCLSVDYVGTWGNTTITDMQNFNGSMYLSYNTFHPLYGKCITRFDGTNFYPVGSGLNGQVNALAIYNGQLMAAGLFSADGNNVQPLDGIALWDGIQWNPFPGGCELNRDFYYINVYDSILLASGNFDSCGVVKTGFSVVYPNSLTTLSENNDEASLVTLFPNPSRDEISISYDNKKFNLSRIEILDILGKELLNKVVDPNVSTIKITFDDRYAKGTYFVKLYFSEEIIMRKIILY